MQVDNSAAGAGTRALVSSDVAKQLTLALAFLQHGQAQQAQVLYEAVLALEPAHPEALNSLAVLMVQAKRHDRALALMDHAVMCHPQQHLLHFNRALMLCELGQKSAALAGFERVMSLQSDFSPAYFHAGMVLQDLGQAAAAVRCYDRLLDQQPGDVQAWFNRGVALSGLSEWRAAVVSYERALVLQPTHVGAHANRASALLDLGEANSALAGFNQALALAPDLVTAHNNRGLALQKLERSSEAQSSFETAIALDGNFAEAHFNLGVTLQAMHNYLGAIACYDRVLALEPSNIRVYCNRGVAFQKLRQLDNALESYSHAIELDADFAGGYANRGLVLYQMRQYEAALSNFNQALALQPEMVEGLTGRATMYANTNRFEEAVASYEQVLSLQPEKKFVLGSYLYVRMLLCRWGNQEDWLQKLWTRVRNSELASPAFPVLGLTDELALQRLATQVFMQEHCPPNDSLGPVPLAVERKPGTKIRIGYFSADFHNHATMYLMAELFERHDRSRFELLAFSFGPEKQDAMRARAVATFDQFLDVGTFSDSQVAALSRELGIDIAVDLKGYTHNERAGIFAFRIAPIQVSYLGYPGTTAAPYIDYLIADPVLIPAHSRDYYTEKIAYLPNSYQPNDTHRIISDRVFTRKALGLPAKGFVFCCFNSSYKITPEVFDSWVRILLQVPGSVLWLCQDRPEVHDNLRREAEQRGLAPQRLVFAPKVELPEHLARHRQADLFLDTLPCNAHTTGSDALWAGLPLLTCMGESMASRVAASLLRAVGLPELVTQNAQEYEALAVKLAQAPAELKALRRKLQKNRLSSPLFNCERFTADLEALYLRMYARYAQGLPAEHLEPQLGSVVAPSVLVTSTATPPAF